MHVKDLVAGACVASLLLPSLRFVVVIALWHCSSKTQFTVCTSLAFDLLCFSCFPSFSLSSFYLDLLLFSSTFFILNLYFFFINLVCFSSCSSLCFFVLSFGTYVCVFGHVYTYVSGFLRMCNVRSVNYSISLFLHVLCLCAW